MALREDYIEEFMPIHELPLVQCNIIVDDTTGDEIRDVDLRAEDLFMISKLSSACNNMNEAVMVSKALTYGYLSERLCVDFDIYKMKQDILVMSNDICCISLDLSALSVWTINKFNSLSDDYILRYGRKDYHLPPGKVLQDFSLSDGQFLSDNFFGYDISDYIVAYEATHPTVGVLLGDTWSDPDIQTLDNANTKEFVYNVIEDSYIRVDLSVLESDTTTKPLEIYLNSVALDEDELTPIPDQPISMKVAHFNNPGGYSGIQYYNFYSIGIPAKSVVKRENDQITSRYTKIVIKYADNSNFLYNEDNPTKISFTPFKFHGTASKNDLFGFVHKDTGTRSGTTLGIYKCRVNEDGLVLGAELVDNSDMCQVIGTASSTKFGVIKLDHPKEDSKYPLAVDSRGRAYVDLPQTGTEPGLIATNGTNDFSGRDNVKIALKRDEKTGYSYIPHAAEDQYGVVKIGDSTRRGIVYVEDDGNLVVQFGEDQDWIDFLSSSLSRFITEDMKNQISNMVVEEFKDGIYNAIKNEISAQVLGDLSADLYRQFKEQDAITPDIDDTDATDGI